MQEENIYKIFSNPGARFTGIDYKTTVKTAAAHKAKHVEKRVTATIRLFSGIKDFDIYRKSVEREIGKTFEVSENYFKHTPECFSIVEHKKTREKYLYGIIQAVSSVIYSIDGKEANKDEVMELLTPSERKKVEAGNETYNRKNDVIHHQSPRTIKLENVLALR